MEKTEKIVYPGNPDIPGDDYVVEKLISVKSVNTEKPAKPAGNNIIHQAHLKRKREKEKAFERTL